MSLKIYGTSDDLVEIEGHFSEEIDCYDKSVLITIGWSEPELNHNSQGVCVLMEYAPKWINAGIWTATILPIDEDVIIPWLVSVELSDSGYSAQVVIECPDDVPVSYKKVNN